MLQYFYSYANVNNFYKKIKFSKFKKLTSERCNEIDNMVSKWWEYFHNTSNFLTLMDFLATKLTTSAKIFNLNNGDEIYYFYIKMLDPCLVFLEIYESANTLPEMKRLAKTNFHLFDKNLLRLEKLLNDQLKFYASIDLWSRDSIRR